MCRGCVNGFRGVVEGVGLEGLGIGRGEQVGWQDEGAEGVISRGGEDRGAVWRPLSVLEIVALILGTGPPGGFGT